MWQPELSIKVETTDPNLDRIGGCNKAVGTRQAACQDNETTLCPGTISPTLSELNAWGHAGGMESSGFSHDILMLNSRLQAPATEVAVGACRLLSRLTGLLEIIRKVGAGCTGKQTY